LLAVVILDMSNPGFCSDIWSPFGPPLAHRSQSTPFKTPPEGESNTLAASPGVLDSGGDGRDQGDRSGEGRDQGNRRDVRGVRRARCREQRTGDDQAGEHRERRVSGGGA
jgi:hypothetical protein